MAQNAIGWASAIVMEGLTNPEQVEAIACMEALALTNDLIDHKGKSCFGLCKRDKSY